MLVIPMASPISSKSLLSCVLYSFLLLCPFCSVKKDSVVEGTKAYFHTLKIDSLPQLDVCKESSKVLTKGSSSLKLVQKYGPCNQNKASSMAPSFTEILHRDRLRVDSIIQAKRSINSLRSFHSIKKNTVQFYGQSKITASDYVIYVDFGTPKKEFPLVMDTGSNIIWTQCKPCKPCYPNAPVFDPTKSNSFRALPCSSTLCQSVGAGCSSSKCIYEIGYGDGTNSTGIFARETISFKSLKYDFKSILIGCSIQIAGDSDGQSGIFGLDPSPTSFPSQTVDKYNKVFSYCIPSTPGSTGYLSFGGQASTDVKFSPISKTAASESYDIEMTGISVGGRKLLTKASVFKIAATIDSGTVITRLPPKAYSVLRSIFRKLMIDYPLAGSVDILETCYDFRNYSTVKIPAISVFFKGGVEVDLDVSGIMVDSGTKNKKVYCLAFAEYDGKDAVFGNVQQKTYKVVFDGAKGRVGFAPRGCN